MLRSRVLRGAATLTLGHLCSQLCVFARNLIVARMIGPSDFGIATTLAITMALVEMVTYVAVDRMVVQARHGNRRVFQGTSHLVMAVRGAIVALVLFGAAWPATAIFEIPHARWAFQWLALIPLITGFTHLDPKRMHREMRFVPEVVVEIASQLIPAMVAYPLAVWLGDYSIYLWLVMLQAIMIVVVSHLVAARPYRWAWSRRYFVAIFHFGWPLLIDGLLMFGIFQGDRFVVGSFYGMSELGIYAVAFGLTMIPALMLTKVSSGVLLPLLSNVQDVSTAFLARYRIALQLLTFVAIGISVPMLIVGVRVVKLLYGAEYIVSIGVMAWLVAMNAARLIRVAPILSSIAKGDTRSPLIANFCRGLALIPAVGVAAIGADVAWIAAMGCLGECAAVAVMIGLLRSRHDVPARIARAPLALAVVTMGVAAAIGANEKSLSWPVLIGCIGGIGAVVLAVTPIVLPEVWREMWSSMTHILRQRADARGVMPN
jgi:O-antigen/teichoic acid export membrane protein